MIWGENPLFILASKEFPSQLSPQVLHLRHHPHGRRFVREGAEIMEQHLSLAPWDSQPGVHGGGFINPRQNSWDVFFFETKNDANF